MKNRHKRRRLIFIGVLTALILIAAAVIYALRDRDEPVYYTVRFYDYGNLLDEVTMLKGSALIDFPTPAKPGYTLSWVLSTGTSALNIIVDSDLSVYADWTANLYTITFYASDISADGEMPRQNLSTGASSRLEANKYTSDKYNFTGWALAPGAVPVYSDEADIIMPPNDLNLYAVWTVKRVKIILNDSFTKEQSEIIVDKYSPAPAPPWTHPGYTFTGWAVAEGGEAAFEIGAPLILNDEEICLYSVYNANVSEIIFKDGISEYRQYGKTHETIILMPCAYARYGYSFKHWTAGGDIYEDGAEYTIGTESAQEFIAQWAPNINTIIFHSGTEQNQTYTQTVETGETVQLMEVAFNVLGRFLGWTLYSFGEVAYPDKGSFTSTGEPIVRLFALWEELPGFKVTYDPGGGTGIMPDKAYRAGETAVIDICAFTRSGHIFKEWTDGVIQYLPGAGVTRQSGQDLHLTAVWQSTAPVTAIIRFVHGQNTRDQYTTLNTTVTLDGNAFVKTGNFFAGWAESASGEVKYRDKSQFYVGENTLYILYAVFSPMKFTVYFMPMYLAKPAIIVDAFYGVTVEIPQLSRFGYLQPKWHSQPDAMGEELTESTPYTWLTDMTFYAMWELADAIKIMSAAQLGLMRSNSGGVFVLESDIDLMGAEWTPIGDSDYPFYGKIYGKGHKIFNFKITAASYITRYYGFFGDFRGYAEALAISGTIKLSSSYPVTAGIFAGIVRSADILNCRVSGSVTVSAPDNYTAHGGGIAGEIYGNTSVSGVIADVDVDITSKKANAGGLFGTVAGDYTVNIAACVSLGNILVYADYACNAGGLIGYAAVMPTIVRSHYITSYQSSREGFKAAASWLGAPETSVLPRGGISASSLAPGLCDLSVYVDDAHRQANPEAVFVWRYSALLLYWEI